MDKKAAKEELDASKRILESLNSNLLDSVFNGKQSWMSVEDELTEKDFFLCKIKELTFEDEAPRKEAIENIIGSFRGVEGINFLYLILGYPDHVDFYFGVSLDKSYKRNVGVNKGNKNIIAPGPERMVKHILVPSIKGNFRGCDIEIVEDVDEKQRILNRLRCANTFGVLEGVPGIDNSRKNDSEKFQSVERLVDSMFGSYFGVVVIAKPCSENETPKMRESLCEVYDSISKVASYTVQIGEGSSEHRNKNYSVSYQTQISKTEQISESCNSSKSENFNWSADHQNSNSSQVTVDQRTEESHSFNKTLGENSNSNSKCDNSQNTVVTGHTANNSSTDTFSNSFNTVDRDDHTAGENTSIGDSLISSSGDTRSRNKSKAVSRDTNDSFNVSSQFEAGKKSAKDWLEYMDKFLFPRLDNCQGTGLFLAAAFLFCDDVEPISGLYRLANTAISLYSGTEGNKAPLHFTNLSHNNEERECCKAFKNLQLPICKVDDKGDENTLKARSFAIANQYRYCGSWMSSSELGLITNMPQKEVIGLSLRKEIDFGLNSPCKIEKRNKIKLGSLVQSGEVKLNDPVFIDRKNLDMHTFVTGVTGSGKTNTCHQLLLQADLPFLVIEPAKTEYRYLYEKCKDIIYFTPGKQGVAPFFLNPFELYPGEAITSRADMLKATMEAAFDMEAAIPQIIEAAIYKAYENKGWNVKNNTWKGKSDKDPDGPFADGVYAFPVLEDLLTAAEENIKTMGFDQRLRDDYIGSVKARLQSLLVGAKGMMLNNSRSIDFGALVDKKVVIELEEIKNGAEKSLLMGFILTNLLQAVKQKKKENKNFQHITLIEEAHRLLSRFSPGDSLTKKQGVEVFSDMLAEVRKYGESLIIVDQIPEKMTPEVLKNTSTKIVHKLFAQDDKNVIGNTMAFEENQKTFLSNLTKGRAIVFTQDWTKSVQVQIDDTKLDDTEPITEEMMTTRAQWYYKGAYKKGVLRGLEKKSKVTVDDVAKYLKLMLYDGSLKYLQTCLKEENGDLKTLLNYVKDSAKYFGADMLKNYLCWNIYSEYNETQFQCLKGFIDLLLKKEGLDDEISVKYYELKSIGI